ncbi:hypothetical protein L5515_011062 [Caenorhabditis briggsae]|uniref:Uncharacterized protein n=1 Tax=Caenorhabditis briggsae TaxID=6238 RepID=A0AAE9JGR7_CAEBR|nr:hypothetical protein L5515_011062 [Caenorhabditis briggsae]
MTTRLPFLAVLILPTVIYSVEIRCYAGLKYVVGQEVIQDTENCDAMLGMGESYCYKFMEETQLNEVVKMGCSSFFCNGIRNRCMETDLLGMKGTLCCCNDRHYSCAIPNPQQDPVKLGDVPVPGADFVILKNNSTTNETKTPPISSSVEQGTPEENSNYRYQPITIFSAIFTLILCKII